MKDKFFLYVFIIMLFISPRKNAFALNWLKSICGIFNLTASDSVKLPSAGELENLQTLLIDNSSHLEVIINSNQALRRLLPLIKRNLLDAPVSVNYLELYRLVYGTNVFIDNSTYRYRLSSIFESNPSRLEVVLEVINANAVIGGRPLGLNTSFSLAISYIVVGELLRAKIHNVKQIGIQAYNVQNNNLSQMLLDLGFTQNTISIWGEVISNYVLTLEVE